MASTRVPDPFRHWSQQFETSMPDWLKNDESARECLVELRTLIPENRLDQAVRRLTLLHLLKQPVVGSSKGSGAQLKSALERIGRRLNSTATAVMDFVHSPAMLLCPGDALALIPVFERWVDPLTQFVYWSRAKRWETVLRTHITLDLQTAPDQFNDKAVGELLAAALATNRPARQGRRGKLDMDDVERERRQRLRAANSQKRWRLRHANYLKRVHEQRVAAVLAALKAAIDRLGDEQPATLPHHEVSEKPKNLPGDPPTSF